MTLIINPGNTLGSVMPRHGVNLGPLDRGWARNYTDAYRRVRIPSVRLHDASISGGEVVDLHCVFPDFKADPDDPANYDFRLTDRYLAAIRGVGAEIYFRLGESIEHTPDKVFVRTERWTPERMARVCRNIVRHYNGGWADGHEWGIKYWEYWCEPENGWNTAADSGQRLLWTGTADQFFDCYRATAGEIKEFDPTLSVGLAGFTGGFTRAWIAADPADRDGCAGWVGVVGRCAEAGVPVDFVSWHQYGGSWTMIEDMADGVRARLDGLGLTAAESHLTEWNYVPVLRDAEGEFTYMNSRMKGDYERYERAEAVLNGPEGAAFAFGTFALLQDAKVDRAHCFNGVSEPWGLFRISGRPTVKYSAFEAFAEFLDVGGQRVEVVADDKERLRGLAVVKEDKLMIGVARLDADQTDLAIKVRGLDSAVRVNSTRQLGEHGWQPGESAVDGDTIRINLDGPGITVLDVTI